MGQVLIPAVFLQRRAGKKPIQKNRIPSLSGSRDRGENREERKDEFREKLEDAGKKQKIITEWRKQISEKIRRHNYGQSVKCPEIRRILLICIDFEFNICYNSVTL